jgi:hypothetical protein
MKWPERQDREQTRGVECRGDRDLAGPPIPTFEQRGLERVDLLRTYCG